MAALIAQCGSGDPGLGRRTSWRQSVRSWRDRGHALAEQVAGYQRSYNDERPHETIGWARPRDRYTLAPSPAT